MNFTGENETRLRSTSDAEIEKRFIRVIINHPDILDEISLSQDFFYDASSKILITKIKKLFADGIGIDVDTIYSLMTVEERTVLGGAEDLDRNYGGIASRDTYKAHYRALCAYLMRRRAWYLSLHIDAYITETAMVPEHTENFAKEVSIKAAEIEVASESENVLESSVNRMLVNLDKISRDEKSSIMLKTCLEQWNVAYGGIPEGQYIAIAGRPSSGKSAMMEQFICDFLANGIPVCVFEKDMAPDKLISRMACRLAGVRHGRYSRSALHDWEIDALREQLTKLKRENLLRVHSPAGMTVEQMCAITRREKRQFGIKCVFLDHIMGLKVGKDLREGLTYASIAIRQAVTDLGLTHVVLAHLNRTASGRPNPDQIKEFDQLYGDVDAMALLWTPEDVKDKKEYRINCVNAKNRDGGLSESLYDFHGPTMTFKDADLEKPKK